jgi:hypothetical protein
MLPRELGRWFGEYVRPVLAAYYELDLRAARELYGVAVNSLAGEANRDVRSAKHYRLDCSWFIVLDSLGAKDEALALYARLKRECAPDAQQPGTASKAAAAISLLLARLHADSHDIEPTSAEQLLSLVMRVPEEDRGPNFWHEMGCWAFTHGNLELLDEAYEFFTTRRTAEMADYMYGRLRLMQQLLAGNAEEQNVLEVLQRMEVIVQLDDLNRLLLPVIEREGLLTPLVRAALDAKLVELEVSGRHAPQRRG